MTENKCFLWHLVVVVVIVAVVVDLTKKVVFFDSKAIFLLS